MGLAEAGEKSLQNIFSFPDLWTLQPTDDITMYAICYQWLFKSEEFNNAVHISFQSCSTGKKFPKKSPKVDIYSTSEWTL